MFLPLLAINCLRNLKVLAPFSTLGKPFRRLSSHWLLYSEMYYDIFLILANILTFIGIICVLYYVFQDLPEISNRAMFAPIERFPLYFGTVLFALEAVGVVIALENNMEQPKSFGGTFGVLNVGMMIVTFLYGFVGFFGYISE
jgi:solute carrier family 36 (proton-coupled amino acid transporter)